MSKIIYLQLLILCGILCQGIIARISNEDAGESSDLLVREKRVISHLPIGSLSIAIENANYMVVVQQNNRANCAGVILSHQSVLTSATCLVQEMSAYSVLSGAAFAHRSRTHYVTSSKVHYGNLPHQDQDGIALLTVDPPFVFNAKTGKIDLYQGFLSVGTEATVYGWGCKYPPQPPPDDIYARRLRSITVPIMSHQECHNIYTPRLFNITDKYICTHHALQYCARTDIGVPLIVNGKLAGIHVWKGETPGQMNPDVFLDLRRNDYRAWIRESLLY